MYNFLYLKRLCPLTKYIFSWQLSEHYSEQRRNKSSLLNIKYVVWQKNEAKIRLDTCSEIFHDIVYVHRMRDYARLDDARRMS